MKRKLIIHVGMGKTGTTSIQRTLKISAAPLRAKGVVYLGLMLEEGELEKRPSWSRPYGWVEFRKLAKPQAEIQLLEALHEINQSLPDSIHTLIWSNESLFNEVDQVASVIEQLNLIFDITVVGYIRSPDSWIHSAYIQWGIKHKSYEGELKSFPEWIKNKSFVVTPFINRWKSMVNSVFFYNFEPINNVCEHFIAEHLPELVSDIKAVKANETPSSAAIALFAYYNSLFEGEVLPNELMPFLAQSGVVNTCNSMPDFNELLPKRADINQFAVNNKSEIDLVNQFFEKENQPSFDMGNLRIKDDNVSQQDINRALLQLSVYLFKEVERLRQEINSK